MAELKPVRIKHMANIGDAISVCAGLKKYSEITGRKIIFCQFVDVKANYYSGATHPTLDESGNMVMVNQKMFDMLKPLLLAQDYIEDVEVYNGQPINIDLDIIRKKIFVNLPHGAIQQWIFMAFPDLAADLSKAWIHIGEVDISNCWLSYRSLPTSYVAIDSLQDKAIINFTERYRNPHIDYYFLQKFKNRLIFAGTEKEHLLFCERWDLEIPRLIVNNFLELAFIYKNCKFFLGNQSAGWNICESIKSPRILEICEYAVNCQAFIGEDSYGFLHQSGVKYYVELLMGKK